MMSRVFFFHFLLVAGSTYLPVLANGKNNENKQSYYEKARDFTYCWGPTIAAGAAGAAALPVALPAMGFTAGGVAAGSLAAKAMSVAATTGYGMAAVSAAQSAGAAGVAVTTKTVFGVASAVTTWYFGGCSDPDCEKGKEKGKSNK